MDAYQLPVSPEIPPDGLKHDWELLDRYQAFSAELLRISLLAIAGVGYLLTQLTGKDTTLKVDVRAPGSRWALTAALVGLGLSAGAALGHRYISSDSMACHISLFRKLLRGASPESIADEKRERNRQFRRSAQLLVVSAVCLGAGAVALTLAFAWLLASAS